MFKTAAYCAPTIAGAGAVFATMGASLSTAGFMGGAALMAGLLTHRLQKSAVPKFDLVPAPDDLKAGFQTLCHRFSLKATLHYFSGINGKPTHGGLYKSIAFRDGQRVFIEQSFSDHASPREQKFVLAHELAHLTDPDGAAQDISGKVALANFLYAVPSSLSFLLAENQNYFVTQSLVAMTALSQLLLCLHLSRCAEFKCDRKAAEVTGEPHTAIQYLHKLQAAQGEEAFSYFSHHPPLQDRKMALARAQMPTLEDELRADMDRYATTRGWSQDRFRVDPVKYTPGA